MPAQLRRMASSPSAMVVSRVAAAALGIVTSVLVARSIGIDGRGLTAAVIAVLTAVPLLSGFGLSWAVRGETVLSGDPGPVLRTARLLSTASLLPAALATAVLLATTLAALSPQLRLALCVGVAATPLVVFRNAQIGVLLVLGRFGQVAATTLAQPLSYAGLLLGTAAAVRLTPVGVVLLFTASVVVSSILTGWLVRTAWSGARAPAMRMLTRSVRSFGVQVGEILGQRLDQLLLLPLIGATQLGAYAVAVNVALAPAPIGQAIAGNGFPHVARAREPERAALVRRDIGEAVALGALTGVGVVLLAPVVPWIFGADFAASRLPISLLALGTAAVVTAAPATSALVAVGRPGAATLSQLLGTGVGIGLMYALAPAHGAVGAAAAAATGFLVTLVVSMRQLRCPLTVLVPRPIAGRAALTRLTGRGPVAPEGAG